MTKREKLATLFGLMADGFPKPDDLRPETRVLIGLPEHLPGGGYGREDVKIGVAEALAVILSAQPEEKP